MPVNTYAIIISLIALCFIWCARRERAEGNRSDSRLLAMLATFSGLGGLGMFLSTLS